MIKDYEPFKKYKYRQLTGFMDDHYLLFLIIEIYFNSFENFEFFFYSMLYGALWRKGRIRLSIHILPINANSLYFIEFII